MKLAKLSKSMQMALFLGLVFLFNIVVKTQYLHTPKSTVFDEAYYVKYSHSYQCGVAYNDLHPPVPKLLFHWASQAKECVLDLLANKQEAFEANIDMIGRMRLLHAIVGSIVPVVIFMVAFQVSGSVIGAGLAAFWISIENATVIQSSFVLLEQFLLLGVFGAVLCYFLALSATSPWRVRMLSLLVGALIGLAVGTKFTGLCAPAAMAVHFTRYLEQRRPGFDFALPRIAFTLLGFLVVYLGGWYVHERLLFADVYQNLDVLQRLNESADRIVFHHWQMFSGHFSLGSGDPSGSRWFQWLVGLKPLLFWASGQQWILFFPNHAVWVGSVVMLICCAWGVLLLQLHHSYASPTGEKASRIGLVVGVVLFNFIPNLFISRVLYMYQFVPALHALIIINVWFLARFGLFSRPWVPAKRYLLVGLIVVPLLAAMFSAHFSHGTFVQSGEWRKRFYGGFGQEVK